MSDRRYEIPAPPAAVLRKLQSSCRADSILGWPGAESGAILAWVGERTFRLRVGHGWSHNAFAPIAYGRVVPWKDGSRVVLRVGYHRMVTGFLVCAYGFFLISIVLKAIGAEGHPFRMSRSDASWIPLIITPVLIYIFTTVFGLIPLEDRSTILEFADRTFGRRVP